MDEKDMSVEGKFAGKLVEAAKRGRWAFVDRRIGIVCNEPEYLSRAMKWFHDKDGNVVDLAASIYEKTYDKEAFDKAKSELKRVMTFNENRYARFRAGFALYRHGVRTKAVIGVLRQALEDNEVRNIAAGYLRGSK
jgi:hypothetical protein